MYKKDIKAKKVRSISILTVAKQSDILAELKSLMPDSNSIGRDKFTDFTNRKAKLS